MKALGRTYEAARLRRRGSRFLWRAQAVQDGANLRATEAGVGRSRIAFLRRHHGVTVRPGGIVRFESRLALGHPRNRHSGAGVTRRIARAALQVPPNLLPIDTRDRPDPPVQGFRRNGRSADEEDGWLLAVGSSSREWGRRTPPFCARRRRARSFIRRRLQEEGAGDEPGRLRRLRTARRAGGHGPGRLRRRRERRARRSGGRRALHLHVPADGPRGAQARKRRREHSLDPAAGFPGDRVTAAGSSSPMRVARASSYVVPPPIRRSRSPSRRSSTAARSRTTRFSRGPRTRSRRLLVFFVTPASCTGGGGTVVRLPTCAACRSVSSGTLSPSGSFNLATLEPGRAVPRRGRRDVARPRRSVAHEAFSVPPLAALLLVLGFRAGPVPPFSQGPHRSPARSRRLQAERGVRRSGAVRAGGCGRERGVRRASAQC